MQNRFILLLLLTLFALSCDSEGESSGEASVQASESGAVSSKDGTAEGTTTEGSTTAGATGTSPQSGGSGETQAILPSGEVTDSKPFSIRGTVAGGSRAKLTLDKLQVGMRGVKPLFNQIINQEDEFAFDLQLQEPGLYQLRLPTGAIHLVVNPNDDIVVHTTIEKPWEYKVLGSPQSVALRDMYYILEDANASKDSLQHLAEDKDNTQYQYVNSQYNQLIAGVEAIKFKRLRSFIKKWDSEFVSIIATNYLDPAIPENLKAVQDLTIKLRPQFGLNFFYNNMVQRFQPFIALLPGSAAPEFTLPNLQNEEVSLSDLKGKYVLIDFWASWCRPCRIANPKVKQLYSKYSKKNFEILGVSIDQDKNAWASAIKQDNLPWVQVIDDGAFAGVAPAAYQVNAIPSTWLIDPQGRIVAHNLSHEELDKKLASVLK